MTVRLIQACANCGNTTFAYKDGDFECLACGDINEAEDLTTKVVEVHELSEIGLMETGDLVKKLDEVRDIVTTKVYKVSDDEWEDIMGSSQLKDFALMQTCEKYNTCDYEEEIVDDIEQWIDEPYKEAVKEIFKMIIAEENDDVILAKFTDELAIEILKLRYFDVEKLYIK